MKLNQYFWVSSDSQLFKVILKIDDSVPLIPKIAHFIQIPKPYLYYVCCLLQQYSHKCKNYFNIGYQFEYQQDSNNFRNVYIFPVHFLTVQLEYFFILANFRKFQVWIYFNTCKSQKNHSLKVKSQRQTISAVCSAVSIYSFKNVQTTFLQLSVLLAKQNEKYIIWICQVPRLLFGN